MKQFVLLVLIVLVGASENLFAAKKTSFEYWNETGISADNVTFFVNQQKCYASKGAFIGCLEALNTLPTMLSLSPTQEEPNQSKRYLLVSKAYVAAHPQLVLKHVADYGLVELDEVVSLFSPSEIPGLSSKVYFEKIKKNGFEYHTAMLELLKTNQKIPFEAVAKDLISKFTLSPEVSKAAYGASINEYLKFAYDPHTRLTPTQEEKDQMSGETKSFSGIGTSVRDLNGSILIEEVFSGSPAERAGILDGDIIIQIDSMSLKGMKLDEVIKYLRGPEGSQVKVTITRDGKSLEIVITRGKIDQPNVSATVLNDFGSKVFYIKLNQFSKNSCVDIARNYATAQVFNENIDKVILDLRNNPGGYLQEAVCIGKFFAGNDKRIVYEKDLDQAEFDKKDPYAWAHLSVSLDGKVPMVVLVNGGSASASELVSGALQDYKVAWVMGERSFGKGTVQTVISNNPNDLQLMAEFNLPSGTTIIKTIQRFYSPRFISNQVIGIRPDIVVPAKPGLTDEQRYAPREEDIYEMIISGVSESRPPLRTTEIWNMQSKCFYKNVADHIYEEKVKLKARADYQLLKAQELLSCEDEVSD